MLGWEIFISKQLPGESIEESSVSIANWRTSTGGIRWLDDLVKEEHAIYLGGNGYPYKYSASAKIILPIILSGVPEHNSPFIIGDDYFIPENWNEEVTINHENISDCSLEDILYIDAWDQS